MSGAAFTRSGSPAPNHGPAWAAIALALIVPSAALAQVQAQPLPPPDLFSAGAGPSDLSSDLWSGSSAALARQVIPGLATRSLSPAAGALAKHVLEAGANAPDGAGDDEALAAARAQALLHLGEIGAVAQITGRTPSLEQKPTLAQAAAEAELFSGEEDKACALGQALTTGRDGGFWLRLRAFCQAKAGDLAAAQLTFDLAQQQGHDEVHDPLLMALLAGRQDGAAVATDGLGYALSKRAASSPPGAPPAAPAPPAVPSADELTGQLKAAGGGAALAFLAALGAPLGPDERLALSAADLGAAHMAPGYRMALERAARAGRMGDVALYVLGLQGELSPADRATVISALWDVGLKADARAYAAEGLAALKPAS